MSDCNHASCWNFVEHSCSSCFACIVEFLDDDDKSWICKERVAEELLMNIDCNNEKFFSNLIQNQEVVLHLIELLMKLFFKNNQGFLDNLFCKILLQFDQAFGDDVLDVVFCFIEKVCLPCSNHKTHRLLKFLLNLLTEKKSLADKFISSDSFVSYIFSGVAFPEDDFRKILLDVCLCMITRCVEISHCLSDFEQLPSVLLKLLLGSKLQPILETSLHILGETAKTSYFVTWFNDNISHDANLVQKDKLYGFCELFASLKKVVLMRQDGLNLSAVQTINLLLQHEVLIQSYLDSDLAELVYDALYCSSDDRLILEVFNCILLLSKSDEFFISCHAMYGIKPVCSSLSVLLQNKASQLACIGFEVLRVLCDKHTCDVPLLPTLSLFDLYLQAVTDGIKSGSIVVASQAITASCSLLKHIPYPLPCKDMTRLFHAIEEHMSKDLRKVASSGHYHNKETLDSAEIMLSSILELNEKCIRISSHQANAINDPNIEEFTDFLSHSLLRVWLPIVKMEENIMWSPAVMKSCFICLKSLLDSDKTFSLELWQHIISEGFLEDALKLKTSSCLNDQSLNDAINEFLLEMSLPLLHLLNCSKFAEVVRNGFVSITGSFSDIIHYLEQCIFKPTGEVDQVVLNRQCSVLTLLSISTWKVNSVFSPMEVEDILNTHESLHEDDDNLPFIFLKLKFFLLCVSQQESPPEFSLSLIKRLTENNNLIVPHPAVLSAVLRSSHNLITKEIKIEFVCSWIGQIDIDNFHTQSDSKHIVGLVLMHDQVASIVLEALSSSSDDPCRFNKLALIMTSAVEESVGDESLNYDEETNRLHELVIRRLPDVINLDYDYVVRAPKLVIISLLRFLHILACKSIHSDHVILHRPRILRKLTALLVGDGKGGPRDLLDDEVTALLLDDVQAMLDKSDNPQSVSAELSLIFSNIDLLKNFERLLHRPVKNFRLCSVHFSVFKLLSTLIRFEKDCELNIVYCIKFKAVELLRFLQENFDQNLQTSVLLLWRSLFKIKFNSNLFNLKPEVSSIQGRLLTRDEVLLAPLNRAFIVKLSLFAMNCSAKGFPGIRCASLQCLLSLLTFVRSVSSSLFTELASSSWFHFILDPLSNDGVLEKELCARLSDCIKL